MHKVSSYLVIEQSLDFKEKYKNLLELMNICTTVFLLVECRKAGLKGKCSVFYRDKWVKEC